MTTAERCDLLDSIMGSNPPPFALLYRPETGVRGCVDILVGQATSVSTLAAVPLPTDADRHGPAHEALVVVPYRQLAERGYAAPDDGSPLIVLTVTAASAMPVDDVLAAVDAVPAEIVDGHFDMDDDHYAEIVRHIIADEIGTGEGANFVLKRSYLAAIDNFSPGSAVSYFSRLLKRERGTCWTFLIHTGSTTLVGASPERHVTLNAGTVVMNPISGTYRYPSTGPTLEGVSSFLADRKETDELNMVLDEELKMMARICDSGGRVNGPYLREMSRLAHTEYFIEGQTTCDVRDILRETMFAPSVIGSPLENAARVISRYEPDGRGYYSGIAALIGRDEHQRRTLDSTILIRTADIDKDGRMRVSVGATVTRTSEPEYEVAETRAKAAGILDAVAAESKTDFGSHPDIRAALRLRGGALGDFWRQSDAAPTTAPLAGLSALVIDAEDYFTAMLRCELRALGLKVDVSRYDIPCQPADYDLVVMGPGPGDPSAIADARIVRLRHLCAALLESRHPFLAVCLSHQILSSHLGFRLTRRNTPNQGVQREIDLFGTRERVGFYNSFAAYSTQDMREIPGVGVVEVCRDRQTAEVHAFRGPHFTSVQFHPESILTLHGPRILAGLIEGALDR